MRIARDISRRMLRTLRHTSPSGLMRRGGRVVLEQVSEHSERAAWRLAHREANASLSARARELLARNAHIQGRHAGQRAFILATGPSVREQDLLPLRDELVIGLNAFWKHPDIEHIRPQYGIVTDGLFFDPEGSTRGFFEGCLGRLPEADYFVPVMYEEVIERLGLIPREQCIYLALDGQLRRRMIERVDLTRVIPSAATVLQVAVMCAIYMGCSPIYLLGADHSWLVTRGEDAHFYEGETMANQYKHDEIFIRSTYLGRINYTKRVFEGATYLEELARRQGIDIFNATPPEASFLDVHRWARLEDALKEGGPRR